MNLKALVVDDTTEVVNLVADILDVSDFTVIKAANGKEAMELLSNHKFDLIVSDNQMGDDENFWGVELIKHIKLNYPKTKTILMSSTEIEEHYADVFIFKGAGFMTNFEDAIHKWFDLSHYDRDQ